MAESIWKHGRWGEGLPRIGEPGLRNEKGHILTNNMHDDNRRHGSMSRGHTWGG